MKKLMVKRVLMMLLSGLCLLSLSSASAALVWQRTSYDHYSNDEPLEEVLGNFSYVTGVPVTLSEQVKAKSATLKVNGHFQNMTAAQFLTRLSGMYRLVWYFDGSTLYINHSDELQSELLHFKASEIIDIKKALISLNVWDNRFSWRVIPDRNLLFISGPPRYIELIKEVSTLLEKSGPRTQKGPDEYEVRVFQLKYAWADDRTFSSRGKSTVVPGIASTIKNILGAGSNNIKIKDSSKNSSSELSSVFGSIGVTSSGQPADLPSVSTAPIEKKSAPAPTPTEDASAVVNSAAYIEVNSQQNAVVVYDLASRMPLYEQLINSLDISVEQVEIEVSIVDISTDHLSELGIDWQSKGKNGQFSFGDVSRISEQSTDGLSHVFGSTGSSTILGSANYFIGKVRLLAESGDGQILSQPSVITLNNVEAVIDNSTTFYSKLLSERAVQLVPVTAGSVLNVTPRIIRDNKKRFVSLDVSIEDGQVLSAQVDGLPQVSNSTINTQAIVGENSSLLVGGYYRDVSKKDIHSVPFLSKVPLVKYLVRNEAKSHSKVARLFMITPRIIENITTQKTADQIYKEITSKSFGDSHLNYQPPSFHALDVNKNPKSDLNIYD